MEPRNSAVSGVRSSELTDRDVAAVVRALTGESLPADSQGGIEREPELRN